MLSRRADRKMEYLMRLTPIALSLAIAAATMASAGYGQRPDDQIDPRSTALVAAGRRRDRRRPLQRGDRPARDRARGRSRQSRRLYRARPRRPGAAPAGQGDPLLCRRAEARAQRRQRARRPGRGLCPARRGRPRAAQSRARPDPVRPALPAGAAARRGDPARPAGRSAARSGPSRRADQPPPPPRRN